MAVGGPLVVVRRWISRYAVWLVLASTDLPHGLRPHVGRPRHVLERAAATGRSPSGRASTSSSRCRSRGSRSPRTTRASARTPRGAFAGTAHRLRHRARVVLRPRRAADPVEHRERTPPIRPASSPPCSPSPRDCSRSRSSPSTSRTRRSRTSTRRPSPCRTRSRSSSQRKLSIAIGAICTVIAIAVPLVQYENFLLLIGAVFVPLFGVLAAHHAIVRRGYTTDDIYASARRRPRVGHRRVARRVPRLQLAEPRHGRRGGCRR